MNSQQTKAYTKGLKGAALLTAASVVAKILSASYRIPLENMVGDLGFYVYQQIYPIYGILVTFALSGFPVYLARVFSENDGLTEEKMWQLVRNAFVALTIISCGVFGGLILGARVIANMMGDASLQSLIKSVALMVLLMPLLACGRGFYQSRYEMKPTAISQVSEQIVRVAMIVGVAWIATSNHWSVYHMGAWAMLSSFAGALCAAWSFRHFGKKMVQQTAPKSRANVKTVGQLLRGLLSEGLILCLFAALLIILQLVDSFSVKNGLVQSGMPNALAKVVKGNYDRAQPLVSLGLVLATSFAASLFPALSQAIKTKNFAQAHQIASSILKLTWLTASVACVGMIAIMPALNTLIYGNQSLSLTMAIYVGAILFAALMWSQNALLHSLSQSGGVIVAFLVTLIIKLALNRQMVVNLGISGASIATVVSLMCGSLVMTGLIWYHSKKTTQFIWRLPLRWLVALGVINFVMAGCVWSAQIGLQLLHPLTRKFALLCCGGGILVGGVVFLLLCKLFAPLSKKQWAALPFGQLVAKFIVKE